MSAGLIVIGLIAAGYGLTGRTGLRTAAAPLGWVLFLAGVVRLMAPGFFS